MTSSMVAAAIAVWLGVQLFLTKKLRPFDAILMITFGYICGSNNTQVGQWISIGISWVITIFNFIASWFR